MVDMILLEKLVNDYINCWMRIKPNISNIWEDNELGCEHLQIFRNEFNLEDFNHDELSQLAILLTRELRGQINRDHKLFWSFCVLLTNHFKNKISLFNDKDWELSFNNLMHLVLSNQICFPAGPDYGKYLAQALKYVNRHLLITRLNKYQIAGPLSFSVLEGLLRLKNKNYVKKDGVVKKCFSISRIKSEEPKTYNPNERLNRINDSMRCFEEIVTVDRGRECPYLQKIKDEISIIYSNRVDVYDMIDDWRNDLIHGKEYWQNKAPIIINIICLLVIDEIETSFYNTQIDNIRKVIDFNKQQTSSDILIPYIIFPPDID